MSVNMLKIDVLDPSEPVGRIFQQSSIEGVCETLQMLIQEFSDQNVLFNIPAEYQNIDVRNPIFIESWFDDMKNDNRLTSNENFNEFFGVISAALQRVRELGFRRV